MLDYIQDKAGTAWKVTDERAGWLKLENRNGETRSMVRPEGATPVTAVRYDEKEAIAMLYTVFPGAKVIGVGVDG